MSLTFAAASMWSPFAMAISIFHVDACQPPYNAGTATRLLALPGNHPHHEVGMIEFVQADLFQTPADIRVNAVNCVGIMGAGIALAFKRRYSAMFRSYRQACRAGRVRPGSLHVWTSPSGDRVI